MGQLEIQHIRPGLWRWAVPHPEWKPEKGGPGGWESMVGCVYCEAPDAVVLIDPLAPPEGSPEHERFWSALDRDVERLGDPVAVFLANHYHVRSVTEVYERYRASPGASILAHEDARPWVTCPVTDTFAEGKPLPGGVEAFSIAGLGPGEVALFLPAHRALVPADSILGTPNGELRVAPLSWAEQTEEGRHRYQTRYRADLRRLLDLPIERVLVSHGTPVLEGGRQALERAIELELPAWGE